MIIFGMELDRSTTVALPNLQFMTFYPFRVSFRLSPCPLGIADFFIVKYAFNIKIISRTWTGN